MMKKQLPRKFITALWLLLALHSSHSFAETLDEAFAHAYATNPELKQARDRTQQADEKVSTAVGGLRPTLSATGQKGFAHTYTERPWYNKSLSPITNTQPMGAGITLTQPIWTGGRTSAAIASAEAGVEQQRSLLLNAEQQLFLLVAQTYLGVISNQEIVNINENNVQVLQKHLDAAKAQFDAGEATRTDVAQAQSRLARARADLKQAESLLRGSMAEYERHVGRAPQKLTPPTNVPAIDVEHAMPDNTALRNNPAYISSMNAEQAAQHDVDAAYSELMPFLSWQSQLNYDEQTTGSRLNSKLATSMARLTVPIYQGGVEYSRIRTAEARLSEVKSETDRVQRQIESEAASDAATLRSATEALAAESEQVAAARIAAEGVKQERMAGTRTVLDELDAEQELLNAQVQLVRADEAEKMARFKLSAAVGNLKLSTLNITTVPTYDPAQNYNHVRSCIIGCLTKTSTTLEAPKAPLALQATLLDTSVMSVQPAPTPEAPKVVETAPSNTPTVAQINVPTPNSAALQAAEAMTAEPAQTAPQNAPNPIATPEAPKVAEVIAAPAQTAFVETNAVVVPESCAPAMDQVLSNNAVNATTTLAPQSDIAVLDVPTDQPLPQAAQAVVQ